MNLVLLRPILAPLFGIAICVAASPRHGATMGEFPTAERFVATAVSPGGVEGGQVDILVERWSTDEEWDNFRDTRTRSGAGNLMPVLQQIRHEAGVVLMPEIMGPDARVGERRPLRFQLARQIDTPAGRRILVATDQSLGFGEDILAARASAPDVTLLEVRFDGDGKGTGKLAPAATIASNQDTRIVELENYASLPVRLSDVRSEHVERRSR